MVQQLNQPASFSTSSSLLINPSRQFNKFQEDWHNEGVIDLSIQDLPHDSSHIEWWYVNSHITTIDGRKFSLFASFFRMAIARNEDKKLVYAHSVTWGLSNVETQKYYTDSLVDRCAPQVGLKMLDNSDKADPMLQRALREVFEKGNVPLPDRLMTTDAFVNTDKLELDFDGNRFVKLDNGSYKLTLIHPQNINCELVFQPQKSAVCHGDNGVVNGTGGEDMFYYFIPRCRVEGTLTLDNQSVPILTASGWYDHEFSKPISNEPEGSIKQDIAWNWISAQLSNGYEVTAYDLFDNDDGSNCGHWVIIIDPEGNSKHYSEFTFQPLESWTSSRTFNTYPIAWRLEVPEANLYLSVEAAFPTQEFITIISKPAFWEGRVNVSGIINGEPITGLGFVERSGFDSVEKLNDFLSAVGRETRKSIHTLLPLFPTHEQICKLVASKAHEHYLDGLDYEQYSRSLIQPIREIVDRGGKSWRSYALIACLDIVGGDSQAFANCLAVPELLHVGSLIVDDVQDQSSVRRGGPSCHHLYGEALAINAGTASYFLGQVLLLNSQLSDADKLKVYELYFETLRAAHAGQAIDIDGFHPLMKEVVEQGKGELLEKRILAMYRLKSAVPASSLAQIGAVLGKGTPAQIEGLGNFFESLGLAFQIIDDVLNLRGFKNNLKSKGEDISCGKITLPVAKAMAKLPQLDRQILWQTIASKPTNAEIISAVIEKLESCGAIDASVQQANDLVESAWKRLDSLFPDSDIKIKLRAFSWYVLARHY